MSYPTYLRHGKLMEAIDEELSSATRAFPAMNSAHEGYAVILEELDELWELVRAKQSEHDTAAMREEAIQIAAMAARFVIDVCGG